MVKISEIVEMLTLELDLFVFFFFLLLRNCLFGKEMNLNVIGKWNQPGSSEDTDRSYITIIFQESFRLLLALALPFVCLLPFFLFRGLLKEN